MAWQEGGEGENKRQLAADIGGGGERRGNEEKSKGEGGNRAGSGLVWGVSV